MMNQQGQTEFGNAQWIWQSGAAWAVNYHGFARKAFVIEGDVLSAALHISAYTDYTVWVNGMLVGRGPEPNTPAWQTFDTFDIAPHLLPGKNAVAVRVHNYAIGTHWHHRDRGGLIAQVQVTTAAGVQTIPTDATWRIVRAECYALTTPRQWWPAAFLETFDFHRYDAAWLQPGFDDTGWEVPEVLGPVGTRPFLRLLAREIPLLVETPESPVTAEKGQCTLPPLHAIGLSDMVPPGQAGIVYAKGLFEVAAAQTTVLHIECDDAFVLFVNGEKVAEQNYGESFAATRVWRGKDEYDQIHDGMGHQEFFVKVALPAGQNRLVVVVDKGPNGWGFVVALRQATEETLLDYPIQWTLTGPIESSGLWDSLNDVTDEIPTTAAMVGQSIPSVIESGVTDYATIMGYETRTDIRPIDPQTITLNAGEFCIFDMGRVTVGLPEIVVETNGDTVIDIGYSQALRDDRRIEFSNSGRVKCVDRVLFPAGSYTYQPALRRTVRYLHISCRQGKVTIKSTRVHRSGYPVEEIGAFECSDPLLNKIYATGIYTMKLLMQQGWQGLFETGARHTQHQFL